MSYEDQIARTQSEIAEKQKQLEDLKSKQALIDQNEPHAVAELLHQNECHTNHTDGCSWFYEKWGDPKAYAKPQWLRIAVAFIEYANSHNVPVSTALHLRMIKDE